MRELVISDMNVVSGAEAGDNIAIGSAVGGGIGVGIGQATGAGLAATGGLGAIGALAGAAVVGVFYVGWNIGTAIENTIDGDE